MSDQVTVTFTKYEAEKLLDAGRNGYGHIQAWNTHWKPAEIQGVKRALDKLNARLVTS